MSADKDESLREEKETGRIEAFSDGVFAIAITLLVLDLKVPRVQDLAPGVELWEALLGLWPSYLAFFISFATVLIMWVHHHKLFTRIRRSNGLFLFLNGFLLMFVTLFPFPAALLAEYIEDPRYAQVAAAVYSGTCFMITVAYNLLWRYASGGGRLLDKMADDRSAKLITKEYLLGPPCYFLAFVLAFFSVAASVGACLVLTVFFSITGSLANRLDSRAPRR